METGEKVSARAKRANGQSMERKVFKRSLLIVVVIFVLALADANYNTFSALGDTMRAKGKWQAVFLTNGQVYFGRLAPHGAKYFALENAHYLRSTQVPIQIPQGEGEQPLQRTETRNELVSVTQDLHAPENTMLIPRAQILFWQNLSAASPVIQTINSSRR